MTGEQAAHAVLPLGSSHPERVAEAADGVAELVGHLNHATFGAVHTGALPWPSSVGTVAGRVHSALWGIEQLLGQLAYRLDAFASDPSLYHDERREDRRAAVDAAGLAAGWLREAAGQRALVSEPVRAALALIGHLGLRGDAR